MITTSWLGDLLIWLLFWAVLLWALWRFGMEFREWFFQDTEAHDSIRNFPAECQGEPGRSTVSVRPPHRRRK